MTQFPSHAAVAARPGVLRQRRGDNLRRAGLGLVLALITSWAGAAPLTLEDALAIAVQRSEATRAARSGLRGAVDAARAAGQLPDPTLRVGVDNVPITGSDRFNTTRDSMTMQRVGIAQEWLSRDKRAARQAEADAAAGREGVQVDVSAADTRLQTALSFLEVLQARAALRIVDAAEQLAREEFEAGRARLAGAGASGQEVLQLSAARALIDDEAAELRQHERAATLGLARWIGTVPDDLAAADSPSAPTEDAYVSGHPVVSGLTADLEVARRAADVAAAARRPNWTWEVSYGRRAGYSDMVSVGVSIPLPVAPDARQDRETAAKLAMIDRAEGLLADARRAASAEYRALVSDADRLRDRIDRYRSGVVALARQRTAAAVAAYRSNASGLATVYESRRAEIEADRRVLTLRRDLARAQLQLVFRPVVSGAAR